MLRDRIFRYFSAVPAVDHFNAVAIWNNLSNRVGDTAQREIEYLRNQVLNLQQEIKRLTDLMLTEHGIITRENSTVGSEPTKVNHRPPSWSKQAKILEARDRELAENARKIKETWPNAEPISKVPGWNKTVLSGSINNTNEAENAN